MSLLRITDDATKADIAEAIGHLRAKQQAVQLDSTRAEIQSEIDTLLESYAAAQ